MTRDVCVDAGPSQYLENISVGPHALVGDEPADAGGADAGPNPYELLLAALGTCASITVRMYAQRRQWPLQGMRVRLSHGKVHAEDCAGCETENTMIDRIEMEISFLGDLSEEQRLRLLEIANRCPVHRTLTSRIEISARQAPSTEAMS
jgi:putative redox protein